MTVTRLVWWENLQRKDEQPLLTRLLNVIRAQGYLSLKFSVCFLQSVPWTVCVAPHCACCLQVAYVSDRHWLTPSWMHNFACTDKYAVLLEQPLYMVRHPAGCP